MPLKKEIAQTKLRVEAILRRFFLRKIREARKLHPSFAEMASVAREFSLRGKSKRIRPYLVTLGYRATGKRPPAAIHTIGAAIELYHNSLLVHDDVIDKDELRRGGSTVHARYERIHRQRLTSGTAGHFGTSAAILAGNVLHVYGTELFLGSAFPARIKHRALAAYIQVIETTNFGEYLDVVTAMSSRVREKDINMVYAMKTARYSFEGPLVTGAMLAGAGECVLKTLRALSIPLGIAFQIQDDMLGLFGSQAQTGKSVLSDIREGKKTLLLHFGLRAASPRDKATLHRFIGNRKTTMKDLHVVRSILKRVGAVHAVTEAKEALISDVERILDRDTALDVPMKKVVRSLSMRMISRTH